MKTRRRFLNWTSSFLLACQARAQAPARALARELARHALSGPLAGLEVILVDVTAAPGASSTAHRHPGFVLGYVLDGAMRFAINDESERIVKAGETFFEPAGALHTTSGSASTEAQVRFLAFIVAPAGSSVSLPA